MYKMPGQGWRNLDLIDDPAGVVGREKEEDNKVQSKVHLRGTLTIRTKLIVTVRVTIVGVIGLKRNDQEEDSVPDPFCKVKYLDKEWGKLPDTEQADWKRKREELVAVFEHKRKAPHARSRHCKVLMFVNTR